MNVEVEPRMFAATGWSLVLCAANFIVSKNPAAATDIARGSEYSLPLPVLGMIDAGSLRLHPYWDPLRGDPRFEKLIADLAPKGGFALTTRRL